MLDKKTIRVIIRPMKKIHFLLALIFVLIVGHASAFNATETIELFYGGLEHDSEGTTEELLDELRKIYLCDIGCSKEDCKKILEGYGWTCTDEVTYDNEDFIKVEFENENGWEYDGKSLMYLTYLFDKETERMTQCHAMIEDYWTYDILLTYLAVHYGFGVGPAMGNPGAQGFSSLKHGFGILSTPLLSDDEIIVISVILLKEK